MKEYLWMILGPVLASGLTWIFARRKMVAEATGKELENTAKIVQMWRELSEGMEKRFREDIELLRRDNCDLQKQVASVVAENESLRKKMHILEEENKKLQEQLKIFNKNNHE